MVGIQPVVLYITGIRQQLHQDGFGVVQYGLELENMFLAVKKMEVK
jgi:hypothetical protein